MTEKEDVVIEEEVVEEEAPQEASDTVEEKITEEVKTAKKGATETIKEALNQVETFGQALSDALQSRGNVVMVRINDEALEHLDMLIDAEITKSRSESAAFLINTGIQANAALFEKISAITQQIVELREQLRQEVNLAPDEDEEAA